MASKNRLSRDQKRKQKIATKKKTEASAVTPVLSVNSLQFRRLEECENAVERKGSAA